jgi:hypothetical protein
MSRLGTKFRRLLAALFHWRPKTDGSSAEQGRLAEPKVVVVRSSSQGDTWFTTLRFSRMPSPPLAPSSLHSSVDSAAVLELHRVVSLNDSEVSFETYGSTARPVHPGGVYIFRCWWTPEQLELAHDASRNWRKQAFVSIAAAAAPAASSGKGTILRRIKEGEEVQAGETLVPAGWDHEHCALCWQTITDLGDDAKRFGYTDGEEWLCERCYQAYIASGLGQTLG